MKILFENLNNALARKAISISELSSKTGISRVTLTKIFSKPTETIDISLNTCLKITQGLDIEFSSALFRSSSTNGYTKKEYLEIFLNNVKLYLEINKKNQKILATSPGISESTISELLSGKNKNPNMSTLYQISEVIDIEINKLFEEGSVE